VVKGRALGGVSIILRGLIIEVRAVFSGFIVPGTALFFVSIFIFILGRNFFGLMPYVFTATRHLRITLSLSLPLWLGRVVLRVVMQLEHNLAHLVPEGTPGGLMPVIVVIETVRIIIRPGTLAVRLAANMVAGHLLLALLGGQGPALSGVALRGLVVGLLCLMALECGVACIQAYVFTILRALYLADHSRLTMAGGKMLVEVDGDEGDDDDADWALGDEQLRAMVERAEQLAAPSPPSTAAAGSEDGSAGDWRAMMAEDGWDDVEDTLAPEADVGDGDDDVNKFFK